MHGDGYYYIGLIYHLAGVTIHKASKALSILSFIIKLKVMD